MESLSIKGNATNDLRGIGGVLSSLLDLENKKRITEEENDEIEKLRQKVKKLQDMKSSLQKEIQQTEQVCSLVSNDEDSDLSVDDVAEKLGIIHEKKLQDICLAFRLTGVSIVSVVNHVITLAFDTFYEGRHVETYNLEMKLGYDNLIVLRQHNLPYFIPVKENYEQNKNDVKVIVRKIAADIQSFTNRKYDVLSLQNELADDVDMEILSSVCMDKIQISANVSVNEKNIEVLFMLQYKSFENIHPTSVKFQIQDEDAIDDKTLEEWEKQLTTVTLKKAIKGICL